MRSWTCEKCSKAIRGNTGYILVMDSTTRSWPRYATPSDLRLEPPKDGMPDEAKELKFMTPVDLAAMMAEWIPDNKIAFAVYHADCDPEPETEPYWFGVERAKTLTEWLGWIEHLSHKVWMGKRDIVRMMDFWFRNRGVPSPGHGGL